MPILRGIRTLNSVQAGATLAVALETLLADSGRKDDFTATLNMRTHARRAANSSLTVAAVAGSARAFDCMLTSAVAVDEFASNAAAFATFRASPALVAKLTASVYGFKRWIKQLTFKPKSSTALPNSVWEIAYGAGLYVAVGAAGMVQTSPDLVTWTVRTSNAGGVTLNSVCYGGGFFVAIGQQGTLISSPDGINWTAQSVGAPGTTSRNAVRVVYGNGKWVAAWNVASTGVYISYATVVTNWASYAFLTGAVYTASELIFGNGVFLVPAYSGGGVMFRSVDGIAWVGFSLPNSGSGPFYAGAYDPITQGFIARGYNGSGVYTSNDGYNWVRLPFGEVSISSSSTHSAYYAGVFMYPNGASQVFYSTEPGGYYSDMPATMGLTLVGFSIANGILIAHGTTIYTLA